MIRRRKLDYLSEIKNYIPQNEQEAQDQKVILDCIKQFPHNILLRDNEIAHIAASGFILNKSLTKALFIHHNIMNKWAWTGGHADGNPNLLEVATCEAFEETGITVTPISNKIASIDILFVEGHIKNNKYVNPHLHLDVAYVFTADESAIKTVKPDENSGIEWFPIEKIVEGEVFSKHDAYLYAKLIKQAKAW